MKKLLFVCTGNICRSPMAEYLLRFMLKERGYGGYLVESAGVDALEGLPPTDKVVELLLQEGIDCRGHRSQPMTEELAKSSHLIFVMTFWHRERVLEIVEDEKVYRLKEYVIDKSEGRGEEEGHDLLDIADPYGGSLKEYAICMKEIVGCLEELVSMLKDS